MHPSSTPDTGAAVAPTLWEAVPTPTTSPSPASPAAPATAPRVAPARPVRRVPATTRQLDERDPLCAVDPVTHERHYTPLIVVGEPRVPGVWAGRSWEHCGAQGRVRLVPWRQRDQRSAWMQSHAIQGRVHLVLTWREVDA